MRSSRELLHPWRLIGRAVRSRGRRAVLRVLRIERPPVRVRFDVASNPHERGVVAYDVFEVPALPHQLAGCGMRCVDTVSGYGLEGSQQSSKRLAR